LQNGTSLNLAKAVGSVGTTLATVSFAHSEGENYWLRFDAIDVSSGVLLRGKAWRGEIDDEPEEFQISFTETATVYPAGKVGVLAPAGASQDRLCGLFRVRSMFGNVTDTLRFTQSAAYLPPDIDAIPSLMTAEVSPGAVSLGENLGERATISAKFK